MKFEDFQKLLRHPLDVKWKPYFNSSYDYGALLPRVICGFILPTGDDDAETEQANIALWKEFCALIPPLYNVAGTTEEKQWLEQKVERSVQFVNPWYQDNVIAIVGVMPLALLKKS